MIAIDLSDLSHSYPFLHLSKKFVVPYSAVLGAAHDCDSGRDDVEEICRYRKMTIRAVLAVADVCHAPWRWDMSKSMEVGL